MTKDLGGKFMIVTGANAGIGRITAETLAKRGATVVLASRSEERTAPVLEGIRDRGGDAIFLPLDLASLDSVRAFARRILGLGRPLDVLVNNAGLAGKRGLTQDGFELAFGTNHLGHFLLTVLLAQRLREAAPSRIVNVSSRSSFQAKGIDFDALRRPTRSRTGLPEYAVSKLANVLFTRELARRIGPFGVHSYALHPGTIASSVWREIPWPIRKLMTSFMQSTEEGAKTTLFCATSPDVSADDGLYYERCKAREPCPAAWDEKLAKELWERSAAWTGADLAPALSPQEMPRE